MAHLVRNNSGASGAISSLQMDYGDSDDEDSNLGGSRNNSLDDREQIKDQEVPEISAASTMPPMLAPPLPPLAGLIPPLAAAPPVSLTPFSSTAPSSTLASSSSLATPLATTTTSSESTTTSSESTTTPPQTSSPPTKSSTPPKLSIPPKSSTPPSSVEQISSLAAPSSSASPPLSSLAPSASSLASTLPSATPLSLEPPSSSVDLAPPSSSLLSSPLSSSAPSTDPPTDLPTDPPDSLAAFSRRIEINAAPYLMDEELSARSKEKQEDDDVEDHSRYSPPGSHMDIVFSDDENQEDKVPSNTVAGVPEQTSLFTDPSRDSPTSQTSLPPKKVAATRLVSYGPDEDLTTDESSDEDDDIKLPSIESSPEPTDPSALAQSVQNMKDDDIRIPDEPPGQCSAALQQKIETMYDRMRREGLDINRMIQNKKTFRNPSIYEKLIEFCHIDQKGTNFPPEIYNPHIWGKESFYDELDKAQRKDMEKREKDKKDRTKVDFVTGVKKGSSSASDTHSDEKKRKTKWDAAQPHSGSSVKAPGLVNLTSSATGTKATVISAVGVLSKSKSSSHK